MLREIWSWNAGRHNESHADAYIRFLEDGVDRLASEKSWGNPVAEGSEYRFASLKKSRGGHGHIVVYLMNENDVVILSFYHTAQSWRDKVERGEF